MLFEEVYFCFEEILKGCQGAVAQIKYLGS